MFNCFLSLYFFKRKGGLISTSNKLGTQPIKKLFISLALPSVVAQVVNLLYNMVDRMYIGNIKDIGAIALTGIGVSMPLIIIISAFAMLIGVGGAPLASMELGRKNKEKAMDIMTTCFTSLVIISLIILVFLSIFKKPILMAFGASKNSISYALNYIGIYVLGTPGVLITLGMNYFISAQGFGRTAMFTTLIGAILNIILDPIFIFGFDMNVKGAAIATVISQYVSAIFVLSFLTSKKSNLRLNIKKPKIVKPILKRVTALGLSPFIMSSTEGILYITFNTQLLKYGGDLFVATMSINSLIMQMVFMPANGIAQGVMPIISFNYGANNIDRVKRTVKILAKVTFLYTLILFLVIQIFPTQLGRIFTQDVALLKEVAWTLRIYCLGVFLLGLQVAFQQAFIAFGQARLSTFMAIFRKIILLIPLIYIFPYFMEAKVLGVYMAEPIADIGAALLTTFTFIRFFKKEIKRMEEKIIDRVSI